MQSSVKLNGGNKFWAISGNRLELLPGNAYLPHTSAILSTVIARYLPAGDLSLRKESQIFNSLTFMATTEEEWGPDLNSSNCSTIANQLKIKIPHLSKARPNILENSEDQFEEKVKIRTKAKNHLTQHCTAAHIQGLQVLKAYISVPHAPTKA